MNLLERILISTEIACYLKNKKIFDALVEEKSFEFKTSEKKLA